VSDLTGRINGWLCDGRGGRPGIPTCGRITYAINVHHGVTPMFLACRAEGVEPNEAECKGMGTSLMYPENDPPAHVLDAVAWEWYKPDAVEMKRLRKRERQGKDNSGTVEHVEKGGLLLRPLTDAGRELLVSRV
jgi:hypothetical protein